MVKAIPRRDGYLPKNIMLAKTLSRVDMIQTKLSCKEKQRAFLVGGLKSQSPAIYQQLSIVQELKERRVRAENFDIGKSRTSNNRGST
jgi:hypothetical protein